MPSFPFPQLWSQLQRKAWMWLFNQSQIQTGITLAKQDTAITEALIPQVDELEIRGLIKIKGTQTSQHKAVVMLRMGSNQDPSVITQCSCLKPLCAHSAALLWLLTTKEGQTQVEQIALPPDVSESAETVAEISAISARVVSIKPQVEVAHDAALKPRLKLSRIAIESPQLTIGQRLLSNRTETIGVAEPWIQYGDSSESVSPLTRDSTFVHWTDDAGRQNSVRRNYSMERLYVADLVQYGLSAFAEAIPDALHPKSTVPLMTVSKETQALYWARFLRDIVPLLRQEGWLVEIADDFGFEIKSAAEESWFTDLASEEEGKDFFALDLGVEIGGQRVSLVPLLVQCIDQGLTPEILEANLEQSFLLALPGPSNPVLAMPAKRLLVLLRFLHELVTSRPIQKDGRLHLDKLRAAQLQTLDGLPIRAPAELAVLRERLKNFKEMTPVAPPEGLKATLRSYQLEGVSWLQFLREFRLHGVLADDMGLGKTLQTLAHLLIEKEAGRMDRPSLIIAPTSLLRNWAREAAKFAPALHVLLLHGDDRRSDFRRIPRYDLVITSYPLLVRDASRLRAYEWHVLALDEAQHIKNPKSRAAQEAGSLKARHRLCLTGTPMENHLGELWSLFQFLMPGLLGDSNSFREYYRNPIEKEQDAERQKELAERLQPLMLRRTKSAVAKELPPKTEILHTIELGKMQADLYSTIHAVVDQRVREAISAQGLDRSQIVVLDALLKLRQVCCHPNLVKAESARSVTESAKTDYLMEELLPELLDEGHKILIFSQFTEMLAIIEARVKKMGVPYVKLTGDTTDRDTPMRKFQKGEVPIFLISLKAGGTGLTLTAADTVIHYDPWWNPAVEAQASDRAYRIGQTKPVFVHKLICQGTIEERIVDLQRSKAALVEGLLTGRAEALRLTQEDIQKLLH